MSDIIRNGQSTGKIIRNGVVYGGETYSVGEVDTGGKWIDGRPVYRLIINNIGTQNCSINLSEYITGSLDVIISYDAELYSSSTNNCIMLSTQNTNNTAGYVNTNTQTFVITNNWGGVIMWMMIEYVKTV